MIVSVENSLCKGHIQSGDDSKLWIGNPSKTRLISGNESEAISISNLDLFRLIARKLSSVNLGLLQQNRHIASFAALQNFRSLLDGGLNESTQHFILD